MRADNSPVVLVYSDGGARGNPGPAAIGVFVVFEDNVLVRISKRIGEATNNVAEYKAVIEGFHWLIANRGSFPFNADIVFSMDSQLVARQLNGIYRVKNPALSELLLTIRKQEERLGAKIEYKHIPREQNKEADRLVNKALDNPFPTSLQ